jgi:hypothetical protein
MVSSKVEPLEMSRRWAMVPQNVLKADVGCVTKTALVGEAFETLILPALTRPDAGLVSPGGYSVAIRGASGQPKPARVRVSSQTE